jgi:hypothetical protein
MGFPYNAGNEAQDLDNLHEIGPIEIGPSDVEFSE